MTAADKLRELLATRPQGMPNTEELFRWWQTSGELIGELLMQVAEEVRTFKVDYRRGSALLTRNMAGMPSRVMPAIGRWLAAEPDIELEVVTVLSGGE